MKIKESARTAEDGGGSKYLQRKAGQCVLVGATGRGKKRKKNICKAENGRPGRKEENSKKRTTTSPPSVLINGLLNNCGIIMQTARLIAQETISQEVQKALPVNRRMNAGDARTSD